MTVDPYEIHPNLNACHGRVAKSKVLDLISSAIVENRKKESDVATMISVENTLRFLSHTIGDLQND